jgi:hypothetical protein
MFYNYFQKILKGDQSSLLLNTKIHPISPFFETGLVYNPLFLFADVLSFDEKISCACLLPNRLGDSKPSSEHKMYGSRIFGYRYVEKRAAWALTNHLP